MNWQETVLKLRCLADKLERYQPEGERLYITLDVHDIQSYEALTQWTQLIDCPVRREHAGTTWIGSKKREPIEINVFYEARKLNNDDVTALLASLLQD